MPNLSNGPEAVAIEAAYETHVQTLFRALITNLGDQPVSHETDQQSVAKFTAGLNIAKRAKQLALSTVGPASPARIATRSRNRKGRSRRRREP
jgi:hypothetical protein